jgi:hypothetical protein
MAQTDYIRRRNRIMWIKNIIIAGCVAWAGYSIYNWATKPNDAPQSKERVETNDEDSKAHRGNAKDDKVGRENPSYQKRTKPYEFGKEFGSDICDFFEGMGSSIADKVRQGTKEYTEPWKQLGREAKPYVKDLKDNMTGLKTDYLDNLVK